MPIVLFSISWAVVTYGHTSEGVSQAHTAVKETDAQTQVPYDSQTSNFFSMWAVKVKYMTCGGVTPIS